MSTARFFLWLPSGALLLWLDGTRAKRARSGGSFALTLALVLISGCDHGNRQAEERLTEWRLVQRPSPTELVLEIAIGSSSCNAFERVEVEETTEAVRISAIVAVAIESDVCTDDLVLAQEEVGLDVPLGDRRLVGCTPPDPAAR